MRHTSTIPGDGVRLAYAEMGEPSAPAAVVLHGVGSTKEFALRCLGPALVAGGFRAVGVDQRGHGGSTPLPSVTEHSLARYVSDLSAVVMATGARLVAGISLGAHVAVAFAADADLDGVLVCLPGWVSADSASAANHRALAAEVAALGVIGSIERARAGDVEAWVVDEVAQGWVRHDPASLRAALSAAADEAPGAAAIASVRCPVGVVGCVDDLAHPLAAAQAYADLLPRAALETLTLAEWGADRSALGATAMKAYARARR